MLALHQSELIARIPSIVVERDPARASVAHRVRGSIMSALNSASFAEARTKVLVVDDEQFLRSGLSEYLRHAGYSVAEAASMTEARGVFTSFQPDVVFVAPALPPFTEPMLPVSTCPLAKLLFAGTEPVPVKPQRVVLQDADQLVDFRLGCDSSRRLGNSQGPRRTVVGALMRNERCQE